MSKAFGKYFIKLLKVGKSGWLITDDPPPNCRNSCCLSDNITRGLREGRISVVIIVIKIIVEYVIKKIALDFAGYFCVINQQNNAGTNAKKR